VRSSRTPQGADFESRDLPVAGVAGCFLRWFFRKLSLCGDWHARLFGENVYAFVRFVKSRQHCCP
jgi:hypothetical protein